MTFLDPNLERSEAQPTTPGNVPDIIPPTERSQDLEVNAAMQGLTTDVARPLTEDERKAADRDAPAGERVYAPASERVPVEPVPGHREFIDQTDTHTREREAAAHTSTPVPGPTPAGAAEPAFTRVSRPSSTSTGNAYSPAASTTFDDSNWNSSARSGGLPFKLGWVILGIAGGVGGWLFLRWRRERDKPINRLRRQARQTAGELRDRVPSSPEEAVKPAAGLTTALLSILIILWQQAQARSREADKVVARQSKKAGKRANKAVSRAADTVSDMDWRKRLTSVLKRWEPSRLQLEKVSISKH